MQQNEAYPIARWPSNCTARSSRHSSETKLCRIVVVVITLVDDPVPADPFLDLDHELCRPEDAWTTQLGCTHDSTATRCLVDRV